ncbi:MAG: hypothetical protein ACJ8LG_06525, partial [Massilia sp.]
ISHPLEGRLLGKERHQKAIARALAAGVREYADDVLARRLVSAAPRVVLPEIVLVARRPRAAPAPAAPAGAWWVRCQASAASPIIASTAIALPIRRERRLRFFWLGETLSGDTVESMLVLVRPR